MKLYFIVSSLVPPIKASAAETAPKRHAFSEIRSILQPESPVPKAMPAKIDVKLINIFRLFHISSPKKLKM